MSYDRRPRLRWDRRHGTWRERNERHGTWMPYFLRKCPRCGGEFIAVKSAQMCDGCATPLVLERFQITSKAHNAVAKAKKQGLLPALDGSVSCTDCGGVATCYDHRDYRDPLAVQPVCRRCNVRRGSASGLEHLSRRKPKVAA